MRTTTTVRLDKTADMTPDSRTGTMAGDIWGGLAAMLVALPSAIAFGVLIYAAVDPSLSSDGAMYGILGAAALGLLVPLAGRTPGLITAPCAPAAAVLAALAANLVALDIEKSQILVLLGLTAFLAGALQVLYGLVRGGVFIKYIPYPVVGGYLSGVAVIIALGQLPNLFGIAAQSDLVDGLLNPSAWHWQGLVVGILTITAMVAAPKVTTTLPATIVALFTGVSTYFLLGFTVAPQMLEVAHNPQLIGPLNMDGASLERVVGQVQAVANVRLADLSLIASAALTLSALLSVDTLKTCVVLDAMTGARHNSNRELAGQGAGNLCASLVGGMPGAGTIGATLVNVSGGATTHRSGLFAGAFVVLAMVALAPLIAWVPIPALAGILLVVAAQMFDWSAFRLLSHRRTRLDFTVMATVVVVALAVGLIAASAAGIGLAILLFIRDQIRTSVLRGQAVLGETSSKQRRRQQEREILRREGGAGAVLELQGNLFFGTTDQLYSLLESDLANRRWLVLDMRRVQSMDYTAANLLRQMHRRLRERDGGLLLCGMPSELTQQQDVESYLADVGLLGTADDAIEVFDTRDAALQRLEDQILEENGVVLDATAAPLSLGRMEFLEGIGDETLAVLERCVQTQSVAANTRVFSREDAGDQLYMVRSGVVRILLPLPHGKRHHLATIGPGDFFGEMAFLDREKRSADAEAASDCQLYVLSRDAFDREMSPTESVAASRIFERLARAVSTRLRLTDVELRAVEDR